MIKNIFQTEREKFPISLSVASSFRSVGFACILFPPLYLYAIALLCDSQGPHLLEGSDVL